jgi:hypothetical protein
VRRGADSLPGATMDMHEFRAVGHALVDRLADHLAEI